MHGPDKCFRKDCCLPPDKLADRLPNESKAQVYWFLATNFHQPFWRTILPSTMHVSYRTRAMLQFAMSIADVEIYIFFWTDVKDHAFVDVNRNMPCCWIDQTLHGPQYKIAVSSSHRKPVTHHRQLSGLDHGKLRCRPEPVQSLKG